MTPLGLYCDPTMSILRPTRPCHARATQTLRLHFDQSFYHAGTTTLLRFYHAPSAMFATDYDWTAAQSDPIAFLLRLYSAHNDLITCQLRSHCVDSTFI